MILRRMGPTVPIIGKETTVFSFQFTPNGMTLRLPQGLFIGARPYVAVQGQHLAVGLWQQPSSIASFRISRTVVREASISESFSRVLEEGKNGNKEDMPRSSTR